ncbi:hypothetical protein ABW21_db0207955 [Orbilia brochopaga]|nr:hypothetical protein ABW21_db0207955 [Drechslerella brochopaga]
MADSQQADQTPALERRKRLIPPPTSPKHSIAIDEEYLEDYISILEPRVSAAKDGERQLFFQTVQNWTKRGGRSVDRWALGITPAGGFITLSVPEGDPRKIYNLAPLYAWLYLKDDWDEGDLAITEGTPSPEEDKKHQIILNQIKSQIIVNMMHSNDKTLLKVIRDWEQWDVDHELVGQTGLPETETLEDQISQEMSQMGTRQQFRASLYCLDISLTPEQREAFDLVINIMFKACTLANDIYSFNKEWISYATVHKGEQLPRNTMIWILRTHNVTVQEARNIALQKYRELEERYVEARDEILEECRTAGSERTKYGTFAQAAELLSLLHHHMAGHIVFCTNAPRYQDVDTENRFFPKPEYKISDLLQAIEVDQLDKAKDQNGATSLSTKNGTSAALAATETGESKATPALEGQRYRTGDEDKDGASNIEPWLAKYPKLADEIPLAASRYTQSFSGKKIRKAMIQALDVWYQVPEERIAIISEIINCLHSSSLIIDDIEDGTPVRRGSPAAHMVFGIPQAINSANYLLVQAFEHATKLSLAAMSAVLEELRELHVGQGCDLHTIALTECPSMAEYIRNADGSKFFSKTYAESTSLSIPYRSLVDNRLDLYHGTTAGCQIQVPRN